MIITQKKTTAKFSKLKTVAVFCLIPIFIGLLVLINLFISESGLNYTIKDYLHRPDNLVLRTYIKSSGISGVDRINSIGHISQSLFANFPYYIIPYNKFPQLRFDIKFKEYEKLRKNRSDILNNSYLDQDEVDSDYNSSGVIQTENLTWVKAKLSLGKEKVNARVRLKGDLLDHLATSKWSFRVNIKSDALQGMRKFSHQGPYTRDFHSESLIHKAMMHRDVIAPRNLYTDTFVNGENIGLMYIEEHFSEPMIEYASRPYGPIFRFDDFFERGLKIYDEDMFWNNDKDLEFAVSNLNFYLDEEGGVTYNFLKNPTNALRYFDLPTWARYLAVTFVYRCFHGNSDSNLRYYLHPFKKKIEPISFDNGCGQTDPAREMGFLPLPDQFVYKLIENEFFRKLLINELQWWRNSSEAKDFIDKANLEELSLRKSLSWDAPFLGKFQISQNHILEVESWLKNFDGKVIENKININGEINSNNQFSQGKTIPQGLVKPRFSLMREDAMLKLLVENPGMQPLKNLIMTVKKDEGVQILDLTNPELGDNEYGFIYNVTNLMGIDKIIRGIDEITLQYEDNETGKVKYTSNIYYTYPYQSTDPMLPSSLELLSFYFQIDEKNQSIVLEKDQEIEIKESLILPENYTLIINQGSVLKFHKNASLIANAGVTITGTEDRPVKFLGTHQESWPGVLILANNSDVNIKGLIMKGATGKGIAGFNYTGALSIFEANIHMSDCSFSNNFSEDALNLINVNGLVEKLKIFDTPSDGLDVDFGKLEIRDSLFSNIGSQTGADAVDISHSTVKMSNIKIFKTTDKGLSIGESAQVDVDGMEVRNALVGLAIKDSSLMKAKNIKLSGISLADVMAYNKKPHYEGASVYVENLDSEKSQFLNQKGSIMHINGINIEPRTINIDSLYESLMQSIK